MAKLSRDLAPHLIGALGVLLLVTSARPSSGAKPSEPIELVGTWHVLVHYTDDHGADPEAMRWEDRVWVFEPAGSRLRWTDYPIVVFRDKSGRFEALGSNRARRVLHAWEPNDDQRAQIESGLEVNPRGRKSKTLRGSDAEGWRTRARSTPASASVITYTENWSITGMPERPVFERVDVLGSGLTEGMDGVTRFATSEVEPGGRVLRGTFERDGTRHGTFRMTLAGPVRGVEGSRKSEGERVYELFFGEAGAALFRGDGIQTLQDQVRAGEEVPESIRAELRQEIRRALERQLRSRGVDPDTYQRETEILAKQIESQIIDEGRSFEEVQRMIEEGEITP
jgi:hypothetical protein